jgi:starch synthase
LEFDGAINLMKGAIMCSDTVSTVSPSYAKEIHTPEYAVGLAPVINLQTAKIRGILNGIDTNSYNPENDSKLFLRYNSENIEKKLENKLYLQTISGLQKNENVPVIAMITRLTEQKGMDLILGAMEEIMASELQFVVLGSGEQRYESQLKYFEERFPGKMSANIGFDADFARRIYAGADIFLMPSKFEPCGLGQMMAARYGTVPIVRATGGLGDSIIPHNKTNESGNGFVFADYSIGAMMGAVDEALALYSDRQKWMKLTKRAMESDFGWNRSAGEYIKMYDELLEKKSQK